MLSAQAQGPPSLMLICAVLCCSVCSPLRQFADCSVADLGSGDDSYHDRAVDGVLSRTKSAANLSTPDARTAACTIVLSFVRRRIALVQT